VTVEIADLAAGSGVPASTVAELFAAARRAHRNAYAPYSRFPVGVALLAGDGTVYAGANVEVASYPEGWCGETSAIAAMVTAGARRITAVVVLGADDRLTTPCGGCRQRLAEFSTGSTPVFVGGPAGLTHRFSVSELLPAGFVLDDALAPVGDEPCAPC